MKNDPPVKINPIDLGPQSHWGSGKGKYVAFDIGNVLVHSTFPDFLKKLSRELNITLEEAEYFMNRTQKLHDLGCTKMGDELRDHFKIRSQVIIEDLIKSWKDIIKPDWYILEKLDRLIKEQHLQVALVSNIGLEHAEQIGGLLGRAYSLTNGGFYDTAFGGAIKHFSCFVGARKPSLLYYQSFLQLYPEFKGCVYVDDLQENLDASKQFGFQTYHFSLEELGDNYSEPRYLEGVKALEDFILQAK
jgi:FMN phosphatase YigB (HAD superfamily)